MTDSTSTSKTATEHTTFFEKLAKLSAIITPTTFSVMPQKLSWIGQCNFGETIMAFSSLVHAAETAPVIVATPATTSSPSTPSPHNLPPQHKL